MAYHKVCRWLDVILVETAIGHPKLVGHDDRIAALIELRVEGVRCELTIDQTVAWHRAIGTLLVNEQEIHNVTRCLEVAVKEETSPCLVDIAREDLAIGAEEEIGRVSSSRWPAPTVRKDSPLPLLGRSCLRRPSQR